MPRDTRLATAGTSAADATAGVVMLHGRGATARGILGLADEFDADGVAYVAPQAPGGAWYPNSFMAPLEANEPGVSNGLADVAAAVSQLTDAGIPRERIAFVGFSHGACLACEFVARNAREWGGLVAFSGGLIGPPDMAFEYDGSLDGTPVFLGCSDVDPHIPLERVQESTSVFEKLGGDVTERIYEGMGHTVNEDELRAAREIVAGLETR
ncbi:alpha/beta hydrolase [Haloarchaeobius sp. TZWWS8]|uniref:alpha/beta hydrolase n=1 Tax=Haloarchaeobius sp. TZWWS8 TaxID=3446121 RepID=UPI003EBB6234